MKSFFKKCFLVLFGVTIFSCGSKSLVSTKLNDEMPSKILWAWERPEDLRFLDSKKYGVAFLAQTLFLQTDEVIFRPRRQSLEVTPETYLIAVTRIETNKNSGKVASFSDLQINKIISLILKTLDSTNVKAVQIDFDVVVSERNFYRKLVFELKNQLPKNFPLTITSLASWCVGDSWFNDFPIDEAVPMAFEMGADSAKIRDFLVKEYDWNEPLCRGSYGLSVNEEIRANFKKNRRFYYFNNQAWDKTDLEKINN